MCLRSFIIACIPFVNPPLQLCVQRAPKHVEDEAQGHQGEADRQPNACVALEAAQVGEHGTTHEPGHDHKPPFLQEDAVACLERVELLLITVFGSKIFLPSLVDTFQSLCAGGGRGLKGLGPGFGGGTDGVEHSLATGPGHVCTGCVSDHT